MMKKLFIAFLTGAFGLFSFLPASACTLWSASGSRVEGGGTLIVKNRDWRPNHYQEFRLIEPEKGFKYYGLFAVGGDSPGLKGGINEKGLVVITASASSIPHQQRLSIPHAKAVISTLLKNCDSVSAALTRTDLFVGAQYLMLADKTKAAVIEIAPEGHYAIKEVSDGLLWHTNHYNDPALAEYNMQVGASSTQRYNRIGELLTASSNPFSLDDFIAFSNDRIAGPDNSIWRTGSSPKKTRTLSTWIVYLPEQGEPVMFVKLANPEQQEQTFQLHMQDIF